ncbi:hypothetical protein CAOG_06915 [Capsaspora owczarzaki ATCC 30864]|uniref:Telomerase reverse transcriptase n=1 Tax=Capsaspora owczarzaki (strain ATCC 30864) TaxID=595528 RepID=A0A0D2UNU5_CAPO3|nr:hypothetical protein CAOG_06915 [Capsaspora owczarzaki ATCC 30864]KJE96616.1 hypothetical protein CAOG_006915 [Capsaspora owczarzaki ATCC 30864]|eukprot:XP_004344536.2 hypothetical protein CAOG_06915 [Capsaspora owczarzaki ATCC 30864]
MESSTAIETGAATLLQAPGVPGVPGVSGGAAGCLQQSSGSTRSRNGPTDALSAGAVPSRGRSNPVINSITNEDRKSSTKTIHQHGPRNIVRDCLLPAMFERHCTLLEYLNELVAVQQQAQLSAANSTTAPSSSAFSSFRRPRALPQPLRADDPQEYQHLLTTTLVAFSPGVPISPFKRGADFSQSCTQEELLNRLLELLFREHQPSHVLAPGYRKMRNNDKVLGTVNSLYGVENYFPNTTLNYLKTLPWELLLARMGDSVVLHLLLSASVFVRLNNGCYMQVSGAPADDATPSQPARSKQPKQNMMANKPARKQPKSSSSWHVVPVSDSTERTSAPSTSNMPFDVTDVSDDKADQPPANPVASYATTYLPRSRIFYSLVKATRFPKSHCLNRFEPSTRSAEQLVMRILHPASEPAGKANQTPIKSKHQRVPSRLAPLVSFVAKILHAHRRLSYGAMLQRLCPVPEHVQLIPAKSSHPSSSQATTTQSSNPRPHYRELINSFSTYAQVSAYLEAVTSTLLPKNAWGSAANEAKFRSHLALFVRLRRFDKIALQTMLDGIQVSAIPWLAPPNQLAKSPVGPFHCSGPTDLAKRTGMLASVIQWLFDDILIPLIRMHFYVTESGPHRNRIFYYRQAVWRSITKLSMQPLLSSMLQHVPKKEAKSILSKRMFGFSYLRLLPKAKGVRPIINMGRKPSAAEVSQYLMRGHPGKPRLSINVRLQNLFHVLTFEKNRNPAPLGASLFGIDDIYPRLLPFVNHWIGQGRQSEIYFVSLDIQSAFDTVNHDKLLAVMDGVLQEDEYMMRRFVSVVSAGDKPRRRYNRRVCVAGDFAQFSEFASSVSKDEMKNALLIDQVVYPFQEKQELLDMLQDVVRNNIIRIGKRFYRQRAGISQGSLLSTLLCSYYYGHIESQILPPLPADKGVLLRFVDDFLLVTTDYEYAVSFITAMYTKLSEYGAAINPDKTLINFPFAVAGVQLPQAERDQFPWCGFLLNTKTLSISADYSRYSGVYLNESLTVDVSRHPGRSLRHKMIQSLKPKCHAMLLDCRLNTLLDVQVNVYQIFLLSAIKFHCIVRELPASRRVQGNPAFFIELVLESISFFYSLIQTKTQGVALPVQCSLTRRQVMWIGCHAFITILERKQTDYAPLLRGLTKLQQSFGKGVEHSCVAATHRSRSEILFAVAEFN